MKMRKMLTHLVRSAHLYEELRLTETKVTDGPPITKFSDSTAVFNSPTKIRTIVSSVNPDIFRRMRNYFNRHSDTHMQRGAVY